VDSPANAAPSEGRSDSAQPSAISTVSAVAHIRVLAGMKLILVEV
jgi:hypothetical protein